MINAVRNQYEKFPYPPVSKFAFPEPGQGDALAYERGQVIATGKAMSHKGIQILVAGCGTLEPLVVAQTHPLAKKIVALDLSSASIDIARTKYSIFRHLKWLSTFTREGLPRAEWVVSDLMNWSPPPELAEFDYLVVSNVIHHCESPGRLLAKLVSLLKPGGLIRLVTYPYQSRIWMRETSRWLRLRGIHPELPDLMKKTKKVIHELPYNHPLRANFEIHSEVQTPTGIVDAFLHACENPLPPLRWAELCQSLGLKLVAEDQDPASRSNFLDEWLPEAASLHPWIKLQILDDLLELCSNPILWLRLEQAPPPPFSTEGLQNLDFSIAPNNAGINEISAVTLSHVYPELRNALRRIEKIISPLGIDLNELEVRMKSQVGSRIRSPRDTRVVPGLSLVDYTWNEILSLGVSPSRT